MKLWPVLTSALAFLFIAFFAYSWLTFPSDQTPEGAYLRIVKAVNRGAPEDFFAYTEDAAQHACFTILKYRKEMLKLAHKDFPPDNYKKLAGEYEDFAHVHDGPELFALMAREEGWLTQLRLDVSGIEKVEVHGPRATVTTTKGTRYSLRKRPGGIWGLTAFTPALTDEAQIAARDFKQVERAAADFARVHQSKPAVPPR